MLWVCARGQRLHAHTHSIILLPDLEYFHCMLIRFLLLPSLALLDLHSLKHGETHQQLVAHEHYHQKQL